VNLCIKTCIRIKKKKKEAEIRRILVQSQPGQTVHETLSQKYPPRKRLAEWLKL
jgi:hypothetical protein